MPKETMYDNTAFPGDPDHLLGLDLLWGRKTEYVQVATVKEDGDGVPIAETVQGGWYVSLDRHQINELIRKLRRARDQAFGGDE